MEPSCVFQLQQLRSLVDQALVAAQARVHTNYTEHVQTTHEKEATPAQHDQNQDGGGESEGEQRERDWESTTRHITRLCRRIAMQLSSPAHIVQDLSQEVELLACVHWLCDSQILAAIPLSASVSYPTLAELVGVSVAQLRAVARFAAACGLLREPESEPDCIAHTPASSVFVTHPEVHDAVVFLATTVAPSALGLPGVINYLNPDAAPNSARSLADQLPHTPRLLRQARAYFRHVIGDYTSAVVEAIALAHPPRLDFGTIVMTGMESTCTPAALPLALALPSVHLHLQPYTSGFFGPDSPGLTRDDALARSRSRSAPPSQAYVTVQPREPATDQPIKNAAMYILCLASDPACAPFPPSLDHLHRELNAHLPTVKRNPAARFLLLTLAWSDDAHHEQGDVAINRLHDLIVRQLNDVRIPDLHEVQSTVTSVVDSEGGLVCVQHWTCQAMAMVAFEVVYQSMVS